MKKTYFTTHPLSDRERKNLLLLNLIKGQKTTSRTELSKLADINIVTISNYVNNYIRKGLVIERGLDSSSGGRRPELIEVNKSWGYLIGIDIEGNCMKACLSDFAMGILAVESMDGCDTKNAKTFIDKIIAKLLSSSKIAKDKVKKVGLSAPEISDETVETLGFPALRGTRALCASFCEKNLNPEIADKESLLYIYEDKGEGILINENELYEGKDNVPSCVYLKPWGSNLGIVSAAKHIVERGVGTKIVDAAGGNPANIKLETVIKAAKEEDEIAVDLVKTAGVNLGVRIAYLVNAFAPEHVIVGGGIEEAEELFFDSLKKSAYRFISLRIQDKVKLTPAVSGRDSSVKGAAFLAAREALLEA